jgi:hypothetical protein
MDEPSAGDRRRGLCRRRPRAHDVLHALHERTPLGRDRQQCGPIAYGYLGNLAPVLLLHLLLLPVNGYRLAQLYGGQARSQPAEVQARTASRNMDSGSTHAARALGVRE